jgi:hypothetical protein
MAPNFKIAILSIALVCTRANGQAPPEKKAELKIEKFQPTSYGFEVTVSVKNIGTTQLLLGESREAKGTLQWLEIQQWDDKLGWQSVGPCRDVAPVNTVRLKPGESLENIVSIADGAHGRTGMLCPRKIEHLGGKVRAILYYAFASKQDFEKRNPKGRVDFVSAPVELPANAPK